MYRHTMRYLSVLMAVLLCACGCGATPVTNVNPLNFSRQDNMIVSDYLRFTIPDGYGTVKYGNRYNFVVSTVEGYLAYVSPGNVSSTADSAGVRLCPNGKAFGTITEEDYRAEKVGEMNQNTITEWSFERTKLGSRDAVVLTAKYHYTAGFNETEIYGVLKECDVDIGNNESLRFWVRCFGDETVLLTQELLDCFESLEAVPEAASDGTALADAQ